MEQLPILLRFTIHASRFTVYDFRFTILENGGEQAESGLAAYSALLTYSCRIARKVNDPVDEGDLLKSAMGCEFQFEIRQTGPALIGNRQSVIGNILNYYS